MEINIFLSWKLILLLVVMEIKLLTRPENIYILNV